MGVRRQHSDGDREGENRGGAAVTYQEGKEPTRGSDKMLGHPS
jgi:hypothetical protein